MVSFRFSNILFTSATLLSGIAISKPLQAILADAEATATSAQSRSVLKEEIVQGNPSERVIYQNQKLIVDKPTDKANLVQIEAQTSLPQKESNSVIQTVYQWLGQAIPSKFQEALGSFLRKTENNTPTTSASSISSTSITSVNSVSTPASEASPQPSRLIAMGPTGGERGGGDLVAIDFLAHGQAFLQDLEVLHGKGQFAEVQSANLIVALNDYQINVTENPIVDSLGVQRDAVTDTAAHTITLYRPHWLAMNTTNEQRAWLTIHEYLRASGYSQQDDLYSWSQQILDALKMLPESSHLLTVSSNQVSGLQYIMALNGRQLNCTWSWDFGQFAGGLVTRGIDIFSTDYGIELDFTGPKIDAMAYSDSARNIKQITFGETLSTFVLVTPEGHLANLTLQTPTPKMQAIGGSFSFISSNPDVYNLGYAPHAADVTCQLQPPKNKSVH